MIFQKFIEHKTLASMWDVNYSTGKFGSNKMVKASRFSCISTVGIEPFCSGKSPELRNIKWLNCCEWNGINERKLSHTNDLHISRKFPPNWNSTGSVEREKLRGRRKMVAIVLFINRIAYRQLVALSTISFHEPENHTLLSKTLSLYVSG